MRPRLPTTISLAAAASAIACLLAPAPALASHTQISISQDGPLLARDPYGTMATFRKLGVDVVRVIVPWSSIAPDPTSTRRPNFSASNPAAYPARNWAPWDAIVRDATADGIGLDFDVSGGSPRWADREAPPSYNPHFAWWPSASEFGDFVHAVGERYSGGYKPRGASKALPRVSFWTLYNEPNFGENLGPQAIAGSTVPVAAMMYRSIVDAAWSALAQTGHVGHDTILIGEITARGSGPTPPHGGAPQGNPGNFGQSKPLAFMRNVYCVDNSFRELRGSTASAIGCPTNAAGSRSFRAQNPGLFQANGFGFHPYPQNLPPTTDANTDPDFATFSQVGGLERELDHLQAVYGSGTRFPIYNDEYGYITDPPAKQRVSAGTGFYLSPAAAAVYDNWAEYLSWKNSRIVSFMQYPLQDPGPNAGSYNGFASGLLTYTGKQKPAYDGFRLPLFLPVTSTRHGRSLEVWGGVRPSAYAKADTGQNQVATIQFQKNSRGAFKTVKTVPVSGQGYFDVRITFPSSGTVRLAWRYPKVDPMFPPNAAGATVYSRYQQITVR